MSEGYLTLSNVKERGWTAGMVRRFLGDPDKTATNPHYRSGPPMKLFQLSRIVLVEETPEWKDAFKRAAVRSAADKSAAANKAAKLIERVKRMPIKVTLALSGEELLIKAIAHYNSRGPHNEREDWLPATQASDLAFLERIQVNYVRHMLTFYDRQMDIAAGKPGAAGARKALRGRIYGAISEACSQLAEECESQWARFTSEAHLEQ